MFLAVFWRDCLKTVLFIVAGCWVWRLGYSSANEVKAVLQESTATFDAEIVACIVSADALFDSLVP
jgi:hypothetical protein